METERSRTKPSGQKTHIRRRSNNSVNDEEDYLSFSEFLSDDNFENRAMDGENGGCSLCFVIDSFLADIFEDPSSPKGKIVSFVKKTEKPTSHDGDPFNIFGSSSPSKPPRRLSPRSICRAWKMKRREHRQMALDAAKAQSDTSSSSSSSEDNQKEECHSVWSEREIQRELKQNANHIQRNFEEVHLGRTADSSGKENVRNAATKDAGRSYRYEKYGSRAEFILRNGQNRNRTQERHASRGFEI